MSVKYANLKAHCTAWLRKAELYRRRTRSDYSLNRTQKLRTIVHDRDSDAQLLSNCVDRFITLFVVFNRLYTEIGKVLVFQGRVPRPRRPYAPLPDRESATIHTVTYYDKEKTFP